MSISVIVATYGDNEWDDLAWERAYKSAIPQGALEVVMLHDEYLTISAVRNEAASLARGDYFCVLDADDELAPGYIGAMEAAVERQPNATRLLFTPAVQTVRHGRAGSTPSFFKEIPLRQGNWLVVGTLIHRDLFWEVGGFPDLPHGFEDWALWSKCVRVGADIVKVPDAVYRYWVNPHSKHREGWRDKKWQTETHRRVAAELDEWEKAHV